MVNLIRAIKEHMPKKEQEPRPYFLGTLVLAKRGTAGDFDVVDGQQRLITFTILLSAIRHISKDKDLKKRCTKLINAVSSQHSPAPPEPFRLKLDGNNDSHKDFQTGIQQPDRDEKGFGWLCDEKAYDRKSKDRRNARIFQANARKAREELCSLDLQQLGTFTDFLVKWCRMVCVCTASIAAGCNIFNTLNICGKPLHPIDFIKARIYEQCRSPSDAETLMEEWNRAEAELQARWSRQTGDCFLDLFLRLYQIDKVAKADAKKYVESFQLSQFNDLNCDVYKWAESLNPTEMMTRRINPYRAHYDRLLMLAKTNARVRWLFALANDDTGRHAAGRLFPTVPKLYVE